MSFLEFETFDFSGLNVHICKTSKFKTITFSVFIRQDLRRDFVTKNALLPNVMQRATTSYKDTLKLRQKLEDMYGATIFSDIFKKGENHVIQFGIDFVNDKYLFEKSLLNDAFALFAEILFCPYEEDGSFKEVFVEAEKRNLQQVIKGLEDDKIRFANKRLIEEMCEGENYSLFTYGKIEDLKDINSKNLYFHYLDTINNCPMDFYFVGDLSSELILNLMEKMIKTFVVSTNRKKITISETKKQIKDVKVVVNYTDIKQGKLHIGCRTNTFFADLNYPSLLVYNGLLGAFPHSKLFTNVREKHSLAYYASSRLESHKGLLIIQSGIDFENYEKTLKIIREQLRLMCTGDFSKEDITKTKATLLNQFKEQQDKALDLIAYHYQGVLGGKKRPLQALLNYINSVTKEDIVRVANKVELDTVYFLRNNENE